MESWGRIFAGTSLPQKDIGFSHRTITPATERSDGIALPREYVDVKKQRRLIKTAIQYLSSTGVELQPRFDVFEVKLHSQTGAVIGYKYIENAFEVGDIDAIF